MASPEMIGHIVNQPFDQMTATLRGALTDAQPGRIVGPFMNGSFIQALWLEERTETATPDYEEVADRVRLSLERERRSTLHTQMQREALEAIHFRLVSPEAESEGM